MVAAGQAASDLNLFSHLHISHRYFSLSKQLNKDGYLSSGIIQDQCCHEYSFIHSPISGAGYKLLHKTHSHQLHHFSLVFFTRQSGGWLAICSSIRNSDFCSAYKHANSQGLALISKALLL